MPNSALTRIWGAVISVPRLVVIDDAVRTAHTVEGGRRCVLQDGERGDVVRVDKVHVALDTVDEHQRGGFGTERTLSADPELGARSGFARTLHHDDTRQFAGEVRGERAACHFQFAGVDGVDGADDTLLALFTVCDYGYCLQFGNLAHQLGVTMLVFVPTGMLWVS